MKKLLTKLTNLLFAIALSTNLMAADQVISNNNNNSGAGSLRQAIIDGGAEEEITFNADYTITLLSELVINKNMTITGTGTGTTIIQANANPNTATYRVFNITSVTVEISNMTIRNGKVSGSHGGGIYNAGILTLSHCTISSNRSYSVEDEWTMEYIEGKGAGIFNAGTLSSNISAGEMEADGGAIYNDGNKTLTITNSTINGNSAHSGGAIYDYGTATITNCTISGNNATGGYAAVENLFCNMTISNSTICDNTGLDYYNGGGVFNWSGGITVKNNIIANNTPNDFYNGIGAEVNL